MSPSSDQKIARIALIGALVAALGLAGCGRKGGLDPPPGASITDPAAGVPASPGSAGAVAGGPTISPEGKAAAPSQGPQRSTPIDWLLN